MADYMTTLGVEFPVNTPEEPFHIDVSIDERHLNSHGGVHGGMMFSLCMEAVAAYTKAHGLDGTGMDGTIHFYHSAKPGERLTAVVEERKSGRTVGNYAVSLYNQDHRLLADAAVAIMYFR